MENLNSEFELSYGLSSYECSVLMSNKFKQFEKLVEALGENVYPTKNLEWMVCERNTLDILNAMKNQLNDFETMFCTVKQRCSEIRETYSKELEQRIKDRLSKEEKLKIAAREQKKDTI